MRILHLLASNQFSGAENVVCQIISMFKHEDIEFVYSSQDGLIRKALAERNIDFEPLQRMSISEFKRVIKKVRPDIIHAHDMGASFYASLSCGKIPLISHIHNNNFNSRGLSVKSVAYLVAALKVKHIFWVSQSSFCGYAFHGLLKNKSSILYNVIDVQALYRKMEMDTSEYHYDVVFVGRLAYPKNPALLMKVIALSATKYPKIKVAIVGDGDLKAQTIDRCHALHLEQNVDFLGFRENPYKIMYDAKALIMTSRWEGMPMCALEAVALGVPIVSTPTDGLKELLVDGETGFLSDDDNILADKLVELCKNKSLQRRMSKASAEKAYEINDISKYKQHLMEEYGKNCCVG